MTAIIRVETRRRVRGTVTLVGIFVILSALYFSMFPGIQEDAEDIMEAFPQPMLDFFGIEAFHTIEGFIATEIYSFFWVVLVALYFAYAGAGMIAKDVSDRRMDLTLSNPISRESVVIQKMVGLWLPLVVLNITVPLIVYVGALLIDESFNPIALAMAHLLSIPYLLVCASIGLLLSVVLHNVRRARLGALGIVAILWLIDAGSKLDPDMEWIGAVTPSRYYNEMHILVREEYAIFDAVLLSVVSVVIVGIAIALFINRDI